MSITKLNFTNLIPNTESYNEVFTQIELFNKQEFSISQTQARLHYALEQLLTTQSNSLQSTLMLLLKAPNGAEYLNIIAEVARKIHINKNNALFGGEYQIYENNIIFDQKAIKGKFAATGDIVIADFISAEQLFGCLRQFNGKISLHPGLVHKANNGVLIIALCNLLAKPLIWLRLKSIISNHRFDWISFDENIPLPVSIPSMPMTFKVILTGDRESLANFKDIEPELYEQAIYSEFENNINISNTEDMNKWCKWVINVAQHWNLPLPTADAWPVLIREAARYTGNQNTLPLCPIWLTKQLIEVRTLNFNYNTNTNTFNGEQLKTMLAKREWREGFLVEKMQNDILLEQILVETEGKRIGQINALSVIECPGHPRSFGEPSRISCVVHIGNGEFIDIEQKVELGGNIHSKGIMIMQAFLMTQLQLKQQIPFSASLTFEQSYNKVDGDSASMAELCTLISALANVPINQSIAITGSVDQFGRAQPVSNINEKIEGFFAICKHRKLTSKQGVIIPAANYSHLSLSQTILDAVYNKQFYIWAIQDIKDAILLLTNLVWDGNKQPTIIHKIQDRISNAIQQNTRNKYGYTWLLRWINWFKNKF